MQFLKAGIASILVVSERFEALAKATARGRGYPDAPMTVLAGNPEFVPAEQFDQYLDQILADTLRTLVASPVRLTAASAA